MLIRGPTVDKLIVKYTPRNINRVTKWLGIDQDFVGNIKQGKRVIGYKTLSYDNKYMTYTIYK